MAEIFDSSGNKIKRPSKINPKVPGVYLIYHKATGQGYIGSTMDLYSRENKHRGMLDKNKHSNKNLQNAFNSNKEIEFIALSTENREEAYEYEQSVLDEHQNTGLLFNISINAKNPNEGLTHSEDTKKKMSITKLGKKFTDEHIKNLSLSHLGKPATDGQLNSLSLGRLSIMKPVMADNVIYDSLASAALANNIHPDTVSRRIKNSNFANWQFA